MASCADIIRDAYEKAGALGPGQSVTGRQIEDGMRYLQSMFDDWLSRGVFGRLTDYIVDGDFIADEGLRVIAPEGSTVTLPTSIQDNPDRSPYDLTPIVVVQGGPEDAYIYDGRQGEWVAISTLDDSDECPLANRDRNGLAASLAEMIPPGTLSIADQRAARRFRSAIGNNAGSSVVEVQGVYY